MTTNSDGLQPNPGDQQLPDPAVVAAATAAEPAAPDPDEQEVVDAKAAAEAEKAAGQGEGGAPVVDPATAQQPSQQQGQPQGQQPAAIMIPKERFDEVNTAKSKAETEAAYWRGVAEARSQAQPQVQSGGQQAQPQPQQPTAEQRLGALQAQQDALAAQFDNGEITYSDLTKAQRDLTNKEQAIREEILLTKVKPANDPQPSQDGELYLDTLTAQLENNHPWVEVFDKVGTAVDWKYLKDRAIENCVARGVDPTKGNIGKYELRKEVAQLADALGPNLLGDRARAKGIAVPGQPSQGGQQQQVQPRLSPLAQARQTKLELQANAPPNLRSMSGTADDGTGVPTESRLEHMSDDEIGALPDATRRKLLGTL